MMGGKKKTAQQAPPINASSKDEENFIQYVSKPATINFPREIGIRWPTDRKLSLTRLTFRGRQFLKEAEAKEPAKGKH